MSRFRKQLVFLLDSIIFASVCIVMYNIAAIYTESTYVTGGDVFYHFMLLYACMAVSQILFKNYDSLWRYAETSEYISLLLGAGVGFLVYEIISHIINVPGKITFILLVSIASLWIIGMLFVRFAYRTYRTRLKYYKSSHDIPAIIIGAGDAGSKLFDELLISKEGNLKVLSFFDDAEEKIGHRIRNVRINGPISACASFIKEKKVKEVILAIPSIDEDKRRKILNDLSHISDIHVSVLPNTAQLLLGESIGSQLRDVAIEDLLGRKPIVLENEPIKKFIDNKVILVTGGGGSIGSELCRQLANLNPEKLIILDIYENNAYAIEQELKYKNPSLNLVIEIASVRDRNRMEQIMSLYRPNVVFHAAAHKHVPLMEHSEMEAIKNNVFGTKNTAELSDKYGAEKFILISTDKAVNPTNVMGASKRLCEMVIEHIGNNSKNTAYASVRFGNVLGSNGSVVPLFKEQISHGGPVTITDKRIVRYFMTIPEAVSLVLTAGAMAKNNELFVLDMGEPVKILTLAENLIRLSGHTPYSEIDIKEIGLRPGEKLFEELLINPNESRKTSNNRIFVEDEPKINQGFEEDLAKIKDFADNNDRLNVRKYLHILVPTFKENAN